jgi:hypothetical protein
MTELKDLVSRPAIVGLVARSATLGMTGRRLGLVSAVAALVCNACKTERTPSSDSAAVTVQATPAAVQAVDSTIPPAIAGEHGWNYVESATADVIGDSLPERIVLTARVDMIRGRPAWDDGQPWQVYVESQDGRRHYLYAQRLQLGTLTMRVTQADSARKATILLLEHLPSRLQVLEARDAGTALVVSRLVDRALDPRGDQASPRFR